MRRVTVLMSFVVALGLSGSATAGPISYSLRNAHFFGGVPGPTREITQSGTLPPGSDESLSTTFSTGGQAPVVFNGEAAARRTPFQLGVSNHVEAGSSVALNFNLPDFGATNFVSIAQSRVQENGLVIAGGVGEGYLLPTFRIQGTFDDGHATAGAGLAICAGIPSCPLTGLASSSGGTQALDLFYTPSIAASSRFTFGQAFNYFFFLTSSVNSGLVGTLGAGGPVGGHFTLSLDGYRIVDANGDDIDGASLTSDLFNPVPEPATLLLAAIGLAAGLRRRASGRRMQD